MMGSADLGMERSHRQRSMMLGVESLRAFREVATRNGFTAASKALGVSQPAVSLKIRRLEERLGVRLFLREGHSVTITAPGRDLLACADEIIDAHDRAVDRMWRSELSGALRLGSCGSLAADELSQIASRFRRTHPYIDLAMRVGPPWIITEMLDSGKLDVAIVQLVDGGEVRSSDVVWVREKLHVVQGLDVDFSDADPIPLITAGPRSALHSQLVAVLSGAGRGYRIAVEWPSVRGAQSAIEAGLGVGILSTSNITTGMRPWTGIDPLALPQAVYVVRPRPQAEASALISALISTISKAAAPVPP